MLDGEQGPEQRRYPRHRVTWPVTVEANKRLLRGETLDVGRQGAKLRLAERLEVGTRATLHLTRTGGHPVTIEAIVWRIDADGVAFFFLSTRSSAGEPGEGPTKTGLSTGPATVSETILVVDDEPEVLSLVADSLELEGYTVLRALDPGEALQMARMSVEPIHLLLADIVMPPMNGVKLADELRAIRPGVKVLLMSAYSTEQVEDVRGGQVPEARVLAKPFALTELHGKVRAVLDEM